MCAVTTLRDWRATGSLLDALELARVERLPRRAAGLARLGGMRLAFVDGPSFAFMFREIFGREIYRFSSERPDPVIFDVGANVGLSVLYFKRLYPRARVRAIEADPDIVRVLRRNVAALDVEIDGRAAWTCDGTIAFHAEGADAGRTRPVGAAPAVQVPCARLRDQLPARVDLLKMDIEGGEIDVLVDCADRLRGVEQLFVEYHSFAGEPQRLPEMLSVLRDAGFRVWMETPLATAHPLLERPEYLGMDLQLNVFATRPHAGRGAR